MRPELAAKLLEESFSGRGARGLSSESVEALFAYTKDKPYRLQITEAHMIEPQRDLNLFELSISGPLPRTGLGLEADKAEAIALFREYNEEAQKLRYAVRYTVWFSD